MIQSVGDSLRWKLGAIKGIILLLFANEYAVRVCLN